MTSTERAQGVSLNREKDVAIATLQRGKVNALNSEMVTEFRQALEHLADDETVRALVVTGRGPFFSFGFDIPFLLTLPREEFVRFLEGFTALYRDLFVFPKPVVAALNGHTIAGGCMLATACDYRIMVPGKAKISLNEVTFGASVFAGSAEILAGVVGEKNAREVLLTGRMYSAEEALTLGLVDEVAEPEELMDRARAIAAGYAAGDPGAFAALKRLLQEETLRRIETREPDSIRAFTEIWYSETTMAQLREITIRD